MSKEYAPTGIDIVAAYDNDPRTIETYRLNLSDVAQTIDLTAARMEDLPAADILLGGFPCQDFSSSGHKRGFDGATGRLYLAMVDYMKKHRPLVVVGENVPMLRGLKDGAYLDQIRSDLTAAGYKVDVWFLNLPDYGLPASRKRIFIVCVRDDIAGHVAPPVPTFLFRNRSVDDAISDLIDIHDERVPNQSQYFVATKATAGAGQGDQKSRKGELGYAVRANAKARVHFHYELDRRLTVRELARLQSFPDEFVFPFAAGPNVMQIGNAVPPIVGNLVGHSIADFLREAASSLKVVA